MASASSPSDVQGWQTGKSLSQCLLYMFENQLDCDVTFRILSKDESVHSVPAHRFMLKARSPEFEELFKHSCSEEINICDIELEPFKEMMRYIYSEDVLFTGENVMHILYASKKYKIQGLFKKCEEYVENNLSVDNACSILSAAVLYEARDLVKRCLTFMATNTKDVLNTDGFCKMSQDALHKLLESDYIPNGAEKEVYLACVEWAKHQIGDNPTDEGIRATLGPCLQQIRFHQLSQDQFAGVVCKTQILTAEEKTAFFCDIITKDAIHKDILSKLGFNMINRMQSVSRVSYTDSKNFYTPTDAAEMFEINVNEPMHLVGLSTCSGSAGASHVIDVTITDVTNGKELVKQSCEAKSDGTGKYHRVYIPRTKLEPNVQYRVSVMMVGTTPVGHSCNVCGISVGTLVINQKVLRWSNSSGYACSYTPELLVITAH